MSQLWDFLIVQPIALLLRSLYSLTGNFGVAIILFGIVAKLVLFWFSYKGKRGMLQQQRLQPKIQELQKKYGKDKQRMQQEQAKLYQDEGISMFGGCLWMFIPFPIIIALYGAVRQPLLYILELSKEKIVEIANFLRPAGIEEYTISAFSKINQLTLANDLNASGVLESVQAAVPGLENFKMVNFNFFGLNLAEIPSFTTWLVLIPIISALTAFLSSWLTQKFSGRPPAAGNSQLMVLLLGPGMSLWIGFSWPAALGVYWILQNLLGIPQEYFLAKHWNKKLDAEDNVRLEKEARRKAAEALQKEEDRQRRSERIASQNKKHNPKRYKLQNKPISKEDSEDDE